MRNHASCLNRASVTVCAAVVGGALLVGCASNPNLYAPQASPTQMAAYAASTKYPADVTPQENLHLTAVVNSGKNQLTVRNFNGPGLANFNLWVNQTYVLHIDRLDSGKSKIINLGDFFNSGGNNDLTPDKITRVQVVTIDGKLYNVQGPQVE